MLTWLVSAIRQQQVELGVLSAMPSRYLLRSGIRWLLSVPCWFIHPQLAKHLMPYLPCRKCLPAGNGNTLRVRPWHILTGSSRRLLSVPSRDFYLSIWHNSMSRLPFWNCVCHRLSFPIHVSCRHIRTGKSIQLHQMSLYHIHTQLWQFHVHAMPSSSICGIC